MIAEAYIYLCWVASSQLQTGITFRFPVLFISTENISIKALRIVIPELRIIDSSMPFEPSLFKAELGGFFTVWAENNAPHSKNPEKCLTQLGDIPLLVSDEELFNQIKDSLTPEEWECGRLEIVAQGTQSGAANIIVNPEIWKKYDMITFQCQKWLVKQ